MSIKSEDIKCVMSVYNNIVKYVYNVMKRKDIMILFRAKNINNEMTESTNNIEMCLNNVR